MVGAQAINGFDPYFLQAYNSPNFMQLQQTQQAQQAGQVQQTAQAQQATANPNSIFQSSIPRAEEPKKKNHTAAWCILGATALAVTAWVISRGKKNNNQLFTFAEKNGHKYCRIPGKENIIKNGATAADDLVKLGFEKGTKFNASELTQVLDDGTVKLAEGIAIKKGSFKVGNNLVTFEGDKVVSYVDDKGKDIISRYLEPEKIAQYADANNADKKFIDELIAGLKDGKKLDDINGLEIEHLYDNVTRTFTRQNPTDNFIFQQAKTNRFTLNSKAVDAYRIDNPSVNEILNKFEKGETNIGHILRAEFDGGNVGKILIENNSIAGVRTSTGKILKPDSDEYKSLLYHNRKLFDTVMEKENKFINIERIIA